MREGTVFSSLDRRRVHPRFIPIRTNPKNEVVSLPHHPRPKAASTVSVPQDCTPKLLDQVRAAIRVRHYSLRTEETYVHWVKRFILFTASVTQGQWKNKRSRNF